VCGKRGAVAAGARVLRGGSWNNDNEDNFRGANRNNNDPTKRNNNNGFRGAGTLPPGFAALRSGEGCSRESGPAPGRPEIIGEAE